MATRRDISPDPRSPSPAGLGDRPEILDLEAGAANERAVDFATRQDLGGVLRVDRAAVEDARAGGDAGANRRVYLEDVGGRRGQPRADRPDRLIGDDQLVGGGPVRQRAGELRGNDGQRAASLALEAGLANTDDRNEPGAPAGYGLDVDLGIGFAAGMAALRMADDYMAAAGVLQHLGADAAGEGALGLGVAILAAEHDAAARERLADRRNQRRRRAHEQVAGVRLRRPLGDAARQGETVGAQPVHLPVAGDKAFSLSHFRSPRSRSNRRPA